MRAAQDGGTAPKPPSSAPIPVEILAGRIRHEPKGRFVTGGKVEADSTRGTASRPVRSSLPRQHASSEMPSGRQDRTSRSRSAAPSAASAASAAYASRGKYVRTAQSRGPAGKTASAAPAEPRFPGSPRKAPQKSQVRAFAKGQGRAASTNAGRHGDSPRAVFSAQAASARFAPPPPPKAKAPGFPKSPFKSGKTSGGKHLQQENRRGNFRGRGLKPRRK